MFNLSSYPPIFVLPTHLSLDSLHQIEDTLVQASAHLTYDITEARLVLSRSTQKKRVALELRSRGVWTEEAQIEYNHGYESEPEHGHGHKHTSENEHGSEPPKKRLRKGMVDLETETEGDGITHTQKHISGSTVKVVKLDWLDQCLAANEILPLDSYTIYQARIVKQTTPTTAPTTTRRILADTHPLQLHRTTTSEEDQQTSIPPPPSWVRNHILYACQRSAPLHPPNELFITQLEQIRRTRELTLDEVGVRAYSTSIAAIAAYPYSLRHSREIQSLPGCENKIATLFTEYQSSPDGTLAAARALHSDPALRTLDLFSSIWGVGARTARDFYYHRGWRDLDDIVEYGWNSLTRVQQIGVKYHDELQRGGVSRSEAMEIADVVLQHAKRVRPTAGHDGRSRVECILVGGYRRGKESSGDVDIILTHRDESVTRDLVVDVVGSLEEEAWITHTLVLNVASSHRSQTPKSSGSGSHFDSLDKALVVWQDPHFDKDAHAQEKDETQENTQEGQERKRRNPNPHRRVDIIISPWRTIGCAVLGWTGDTTFERDLRRYAKKIHGWRFDSSGIRQIDTGHVVDLEDTGRTWEERERLVMEGLGVGWRPPEERCSR
ncbi:hypothetical protein EYZ11_002870 [Aspergillus tanneri]|uniref:BRCT domain-containing protein n=1 Tax=Aspergillus tanneri TaxID=1220188 RepID=A0A4V6RQX1_9EURO|nr:hypothetical protein EYZ11_002870 [Aspergillus tanneri]